jgi:hypothetical protein
VRPRDRGEPQALRGYAELTLAAATLLNPYVGYDGPPDRQKADATGRSLRGSRARRRRRRILERALDYRAWSGGSARCTHDGRWIRSAAAWPFGPTAWT